MENPQNNKEQNITIARLSRYIIYLTIIILVLLILQMVSLFNLGSNKQQPQLEVAEKTVYSAGPADGSAGKIPADAWKAPDTLLIPKGNTGEMIRYGKALIVRTAEYFGPGGTIARISNGMNCQNCHLDGGTKLFANNFGSFISDFPKLSNRSGNIEPASERLVACFERSLDGKAPDTSSKEIRAMLAYMKWIGQDVKKGQKLTGTATEKLKYLNRTASPLKGRAVFISKCRQCHGAEGEGVLAAGGKSFTYPPLWGKNSYNDGAGMYRITNFAGFVKANMPFGASYQNPQLSDEEAWDVAAFVNSQPRPHKDQRKDWKDFEKKPVDFPFGPYADRFTAKEHKYGPFQPIFESQKLNKKQKS